MNATLPYIRTQLDLKTELGVLINDTLTTGTKWTAAQAYAAINQALQRWADDVKILYKYTLTNGYEAGENEYTLPAYIRPPIFPEIYLPNPFFESAPVNPSREWRTLQGWDMQPDGAGANILRVYYPRTQQGQVWFYAPNSRVPTTLPTTSGSTSDTATTMTLGSAVDVDDVGLVKVGAEYISYAGVTRDAATTVLTNLGRGLYGSSAATHNTGSTVTWCVGADTLSLYDQLHNQARAHLAAMKLFDGGTHERSQYEKQMGYYQQLANDYWQTYTPARLAGSVRLNRKTFAFR